MSPQVIAAIIAAGVGVLTVAATVVVQVSGRRATSRDTKQSFKEQREQLDTTLAAQCEQLDRTLAEQRTRTLNERFATAAGQLGSDTPPAVRLAGVYAMAGLADDWPENRQTCVDVLCAYLRLPHDPDSGDDASQAEGAAYRADREIRHTIIRVITAHLKDGAAVSWQGLDFDFRGVVFNGGDFSDAEFSGGRVAFNGAKFSGGEIYFNLAKFSGGEVDFTNAEFSGGEVYFSSTDFSGAQVGFEFAKFSGGTVDLRATLFSGGLVNFYGAEFSGGTVVFTSASFSGGQVSFNDARFSGGEVSFARARFSGAKVSFDGAEFSGGTVNFRAVEFSGGKVDFSSASDWSFPPAFPWTDTPPPGVTLPRKKDQPHA